MSSIEFLWKACGSSKDCILQMACSSTGKNHLTVAVAGTDSTICVYRGDHSRPLQRISLLNGHSAQVSGLAMSKDSPLSTIYSISHSGELCSWDLRVPGSCAQQFAPAPYIPAETSYLSVDCNSDGRLLCVGSDENDDCYLLFWDARSPRACAGVYTESHSDDITCVQFHPRRPQSLLSASTDGLICMFDVRQRKEEDALQQTLNLEAAAIRTGWWCDENAVYGVSSMDSARVWCSKSGDQLIDLKADSVRRRHRPTHMEYLVHLSPVTRDCVNVLWGTHAGSLCVQQVSASADSVAGEITVSDAHTATVRCCWISEEGDTMITAGEDGNICAWKLQTTSEDSEMQSDDDT